MVKTLKNNKMRIHIIGVSRNPSTPNIAMDPYAMVSYYLTTYLHKAGHEIHYYGYKESTVKCTKKWECADSKVHKKYYVTDFEKNHWTDPAAGNHIYFEKASELLLKNHEKNDIVICMWSPGVDHIRKYFISKGRNILRLVDGHIGHRVPSLETKYHVWSSHSNRHFNYGKYNLEDYWHDVTIYPMANELANFEYEEKKKDYFLFFGRLEAGKGVGIFLELAKHFPNYKFVLAGQGDHSFNIPSNVKEVGLLNVSQRKKYLKDAKAVISPSHYAEPFGLTAIEAGLSGTPIICTDHGGYTESVIDKVTGFRCSYFNDFVNAINNIDSINPKDCRNNAKRFTAEVLIKDWEKYLKRISSIGWYNINK